MPFEGDDFFQLAAELAERTGNEAAARSAVGRAYFATLGRASEAFRAEDIAISPLRPHVDVARALRNSAVVGRAAAGKGIDQLLRMRNRVDYVHTLDDDPARLARDALDLARAVIRAFDDEPSPPR